MILMFLIFVLIIGISFYPIYLLLRKISFDLKGYEIIIYQISNILIFHIGHYYQFNYYQSFGGIYLLLLLIFYHIVKMIKINQYTSLSTLALYFVCTIGNGISLYFVPYTSWDALIYIIGIIILGIITMLFLLLINLITLIIRNAKQINNKNINIFNNPIKIITLILFVILPFIYGYIGKILEKNIETDKQEEARTIAIDYLNKKYGDGKYIINSIEKSSGCGLFDCSDEVFGMKVSSSYFDEEFYISLDRDTLNIVEDEFIIHYFREYHDVEVYDYSDVENYLKELKIKNLTNEDYTINIEYSKFDIDAFESKNFGHCPLLEEIMEYMSFSEVTIDIHKKYKKEDIELFSKDIIKIYEIIKNNNIEISESKIIHFDFDYNNPFNESNIHYNDGGYINDVGSMYYIYVKPTPHKVEKKDKELIMEITSIRLECEAVKLRLYNDNTYEYIFSTKDTGYKTGVYNIDTNKLIDNINNYEKDNIGPYIITANNKKYEIYDTSIELKELLSSINIELDKCISYDFIK